jgi:flagellin
VTRINTNIAAMTAQRNISNTDAAFQRTLGRLSSGFRINRAADDAAGLGIANRFRADIRALNQATANASQANSLLQVAEGATNLVANVLDRMKELSSQAASDNVNADGRALIQEEFSQLQQLITRIVDTTNFQGVQLLAGGQGGSPAVPASVGGTAALTGTIDGLAGLSNASVAIADPALVQSGGYGLSTTVDGNDVTFTLTAPDGTTTATQTLTLAAGLTTAAGSISLSAGGVSVGFDFELGATQANLVQAVGTVTGTAAQAEVAPTFNSLKFMVSVSGNSTSETGLAADFVELNFLDLRPETLGIAENSSSYGREEWAALINNIDSAIGGINAAFGQIGAAQNRLDFAQANAATAMENFSAAESVIRDANFATEAAEFARLQILQQTQIAMLSQANLAPQSVLQLIQ